MLRALRLRTVQYSTCFFGAFFVKDVLAGAVRMCSHIRKKLQCDDPDFENFYRSPEFASIPSLYEYRCTSL